MCRDLKVVPDKFRDVVGVRENVKTHFEKLPRLRRRAIWSGVSGLLKTGIFAAKARLSPHIQLSLDDGVYQYGSINHGHCVTVVGISGRKLILYAVVDKLRLLKRAGQESFCTILDEQLGDSLTGRVRVLIADYQYIVWSACVGLKERVSQFLMELLPEQTKPIWQQERLYCRN